MKVGRKVIKAAQKVFFVRVEDSRIFVNSAHVHTLTVSASTCANIDCECMQAHVLEYTVTASKCASI